MDNIWRSTTIIAVRRNGRIAIGGDGQVSLGPTIMKHHAKKVRTLNDGNVIVGFAGATADAFALLERLDGKIKDYPKNLLRASTELAKEWRTDKALRRLECMMLVADSKQTLLLSGSGDVIEPDEGVVTIGSGGQQAYAAGIALMRHTEMTAPEIVKESLTIASSLCVYTNNCFHIEELKSE